MTLTVSPPTAVWGLLCAIIVITGAVSSNHGPRKPRCTASKTPWWEILNHVKNKDEIKIPKLSCISSNPSIFNIMQETKDHCTGEDYKVTFYYQNDQHYIELGSMVIDKYLFDDVLKKYTDWSLTNQKLRPKNKWNTSKANKGSNDNNKLSNKELNQVFESLQRDPCEDSLVNNTVKGLQPAESIREYDFNNHKNVIYSNPNTQKKENQDIYEDNESYIINDNKYININSKFNPKYNYFEVSIPEDIDTSSSPTIINVQIDETNKNMAKNGKVNINYNKGSHSYAQVINIPSEYQNLFLDDDVYDLNISDIFDLLVNEGYEVNLNEPIEFNLENTQDIDNIEPGLVNTYTRDTADYQKNQQEDYFNNIVAIEPSHSPSISTLDDNDINLEEQPFYVTAVARDSKYTDIDSNEYIVDTCEDMKYYKDLPKDANSKYITIHDPNTFSSTYQIKKPLKESETESKSLKNTNFMINANPETITSESLISTQTSPLNKEPKPSPSFHFEADSQSLNSVVVEVTPSTSIETLPVNTNEPTYTSTYLPETKSSTIPLTLHELLPLKTTSPALSYTNSISDSPLPADTSYVSVPPLNYKNQIAKEKIKGCTPAFPKNKLWTQKYVQPIEIPLNPHLSLSTLKLPTSFISVSNISPSLAPKTANFVTQPSMAAVNNLNTKADLLKPPSVSQTPVTVSAPSASTPYELSEKGLRHFLQLPEIVTVSLSSPEHTISPSNILLSKIPQVTEASMSADTSFIYDDMTKSSKYNDYTPLQDIISSTDSLATTPTKDYTKVLHSQQPIVENYKLLQQFLNNKQIPAFKNTVPNGMTSPMGTKAYFTPNINPGLTTFMLTKEEYTDPKMTSIPKLAPGSLVSYTIQPKVTLDKPTYLTATSIAPKSESTPKEFSPLPHSISGIPINSYTSPLTYSSNPLSISNYWKTIPASPVKPLKGKYQSVFISDDRANIISTSPSNFIEPLQSYDNPLIEKFKTQGLLPCTNLPKSKAVLKPIYEASSDLLLNTISPNTVSFITPMHTEQILKRIPIISSLELLTDQNYIQFARPSSLFNKHNFYTFPSKSNVKYLPTDKPFAVPVTSLPLTVKPIETISEATNLLTDRATPAWSAFKTTPLPEIPVPLSEICATPFLSDEFNNFKSISLKNTSTASSIPLQPENKISLKPPTISPLSNSILQSSLLKPLSASPYVILDDKELNTKTTATSQVLPAPYTSQMLNAKVLNISPLKYSNSLVSYKKLPTYSFQPKPLDDIPMSPVADNVTPILSPLNYLSLSPTKAPCTKPPTSTILTTPLLREEFTLTSNYTFQPHLPPFYVSPLYSKAAPIHTILSNFVTPQSYSKFPIYEDIPQTLPPISPMKEIFYSRSPLFFAKSSSAASSTPLSQAIDCSPLLAEKVITEAPYVTPLSIEKSQSIPEPITPIVPLAAYTSPLRGTTMKNPWISLQNQQRLYPMLSEYTPLSVTSIPILSPLRSKTSQWKPLEHYTLPHLSVDYTPVLEKETIPSIPLSTLTSKLSNPQYLPKQHVPIHSCKHETLSSPQYSVPCLPKFAKHTSWSRPYSSSLYSEKDIPILHTEYSQGVVSSLPSPDFSSKSKLYCLTYAEPLPDLTPLNSNNLKKSPLNSIYSDLKSPTYSTLLSSPITNQIIPNTLSTPVINVSPVETITQILPSEIDNIKYAPCVKNKFISETLTSSPLSVTSNLLCKKVPQIISPLQPPEPQIITMKALFSKNLLSQLPYYEDISDINKYSPQVTSPISTLSVSELKNISPVASQTIPYIEPNINTCCKWSPKINAPTISNITPCTYTPLTYSNIAEPIIGTPLTGTPLSEISIDTSIINRHDPLFTLKVRPLTKHQLQTLPLDSTVTSLLTKYRLPVLSPELKPIASVLPATIQENKLSLNAFSPLSSLLLPTVSSCQYKPSTSSFLSPVPIKPIYPAESNAQFNTPLNYLQTLKPSTLPTASVSYTSIQPLFIPTSYQISLKKQLDLSPSDYAALDITKHIAPTLPVSLPIYSKFNPLPYTDRISESLIPISPLSELKYVEYTPASSIPINPFSKLFSFIDSAPVLVSTLQPSQLETNSPPSKSPLLPINSLLNLKQDPLLPIVNKPLTPVTISPSVTHVSSPVNLININPTEPSPITQPLELMYSPYTTSHSKPNTAIPTLSTLKPLLPKITPAISIQPLFTPKLCLPSAASITTAMNSLDELHNIQSGLILPTQILRTSITPFDSTAPLRNLKLASTSPLYSISPETMQTSHIPTSSLHNKPLPTPVLTLTSSPVNTVSNANLPFYDPVPLLEPIRYSTPTQFPIRQLPLKYTELTPKKSSYQSFTPCSSIKNAPFSVINSSPLSKPPSIIPCSIHLGRVSAPTMTPHSLPIFPIHCTFTSAPITYAPQPSSLVSKSVLSSSAQQPYSFAKYITPKVSPLSTKLNNICEMPLAFPCNFNPLNPVLKQVSSISANPKLSNAEYISSLSNLPVITPVSIPPLLNYKTPSTTPNYLVSPSSIIKPLMSSPLSESSTESPITVSPIQTPLIQYSTPFFTPQPFKPCSITPHAPRPLYTTYDPKVVSPIVTKYSNIALDTSKSTPTTTTFITPLSNPNSKRTSNLQRTPQEFSRYMATKSPLKTMKPCYASQPSIFTPNYISNFITNTLPMSRKPLSSNQYSNIKINSQKDFSPIMNVSPLTSIQYKTLQPLVLPITNSIVNPVSKTTMVPIKSFPTLPFTELPLSSNSYTLSSPTPFVTPLFTPISSTLDPPSSPMEYVPSLVPGVTQEVIQPLKTNIGTPTLSLTQSSPPKTTLDSTYISLKDDSVTPAEFMQTLQSIPSSKVSLSPSNVKKPIMYEQPLPYKLVSNRNNFAEYYHNPSYSISSFSNDNICKPSDSIKDEKSQAFKTVLNSNSYSNPLTTVYTWKEIPVKPVAQAASIDTRYIDDSMFKIYPLPSKCVSCAPNLETLKCESHENNLKSFIPVVDNNVVPLELQNFINNNKNIKFDRQSNADVSIPLGNMIIANKERNNLIAHNISPSIDLRMWPSNVTLVEAKLQLKFKDVTVNNFQPVVNELNTFDVNEIQKQVKDYIRNKYGKVIVIPKNYSLNSQYDVIKDCSSTYDNRCNLLWPADTLIH